MLHGTPIQKFTVSKPTQTEQPAQALGCAEYFAGCKSITSGFRTSDMWFPNQRIVCVTHSEFLSLVINTFVHLGDPPIWQSSQGFGPVRSGRHGIP